MRAAAGRAGGRRGAGGRGRAPGGAAASSAGRAQLTRRNDDGGGRAGAGLGPETSPCPLASVRPQKICLIQLQGCRPAAGNDTEASPEAWPRRDPGVREDVHRPHADGGVGREGGLEPPQNPALPEPLAAPGLLRSALLAAALRGHEGVQGRRPAGAALPAVAQHGPHAALGPAPLPAEFRQGRAAGVHPPAGGRGQGLGPRQRGRQPLHPARAPGQRALAGRDQRLPRAPVRHPVPRGLLLPRGRPEPRVPPGRPRLHPRLGGRRRRLQAGRELRAHGVRAAGGEEEGLRAGALAVRARPPAHRGGHHEHLRLLDPRGRGAGAGDPAAGGGDPAGGGETEPAGPGPLLGRVPRGGAEDHHAGAAASPAGGPGAGSLRLGHGLPGVPGAPGAVPGPGPPHSHHGPRARAHPALPEGAEGHPVRGQGPRVGAPGVTPQAARPPRGPAGA